MIKGLISLKTLIQNNGQNKHVFLERQLMSHIWFISAMNICISCFKDVRIYACVQEKKILD